MEIARNPMTLAKKRWLAILILSILMVVLFISSIFIGSSHISFIDGLMGLFGQGDQVNVVIVQNIRLPRIIAAVLVGAALSISGVIMQTMSNNVMASPSTLTFLPLTMTLRIMRSSSTEAGS